MRHTSWPLAPIVATIALAASGIRSAPVGEGPAAQEPAAHPLLTPADVLAQTAPPADRRIPYGDAPLQFGELRVPATGTPPPVAIVIHGGCWRNQYGYDLMSALSAALTARGVATWNIEYRRVGDPGGGWPGTFLDVAAAADALRRVGETTPHDLSRVVAVGHSAGGHLALWLAARARLPGNSPLFTPRPLPLSGVVSIAGVPDLQAAVERGVCGPTIPELVGGTADGAAARYAHASPGALLPLGVPQHLITGGLDRVVPVELQHAHQRAARQAGDEVAVTIVEGAGHFEPVVPASFAWPEVERAVLARLGSSPAR
jgi:acetyl esterase/lipase